MSLHSIKLITFDVTNTLLKFKMPPWQYYTLVAKDHGFIGTDNDVKKKLNGNINVMWEKYPNYGKTSISWKSWWASVVKMTLRDHLPAEADLDSIANKLISQFGTSECWCVADGGHELLDELKQLNVPLGVISNFDPRLRDILKNLKLLKYFEFILTSYDVGFSKPDKRIFESALKMMNCVIEPSEALHIGDDPDKDYGGARSAGWHAVLINSNKDSQEPPKPQHVFSSLKDLCVTIQNGKLIL